MNLLKGWKMLRGYKRQIGALMAIIPVVLQLFGIENEQTETIYKAVESLGVIVFGIGWVDKGAVVVTDSLKKKK